MKIAICEDDYLQAKELKRLIRTRPEDHDIYMYSSGEGLLEAVKSGMTYDLLFLDIRMKKLNGLETAKYLREYDKKIFIIIVTTLMEYAIKGYSVNAFDFILKPVTEKRFKECFLRVENEFVKLNERKYLVDKRHEKIFIDHNDIYYMESNGRLLHVYTSNEKYSHYKNISEEEKHLDVFGYIRCHRSYLVNLNMITRVKSSSLLLKSGEEIPLSKKRYKAVYDAFTNYMIGDVYGL